MSLAVEAIEDRLREVLLARASQPIDPAEITPDVALLGGGLKLDSVALLEFIVGVEEAFDIILDDSQLTVEHFAALRTLAEYIRVTLEAQAAG